MSSALTGREVIYEFHRLGQYIKVVAMDVATQEEISITGAVGAPREYLQKIAYDKLLLVLKQKGLL